MKNDRSLITAFILSSPRSGSTLLATKLGQYKEVFVIPETHFWVFQSQYKGDPLSAFKKENVIKNWLKYHTIKSWNIDHSFLHENLIANANSWKDIFELSVGHFLEFNSIKAKILVEKSPPHIFKQQAIRNLYPNATFIYLTRDPRDVVASLKTSPWSTSNVLINSLVWRKGIRSMVDNNSVFVKYENLVMDESQVIEAILHKIDDNLLSYDKVQINQSYIHYYSQHDSWRAQHLAKSESNTSDRYINTFREKLSRTDKELEIIEFICRKEMERFEYTRAGSGKGFYASLFSKLVDFGIKKIVNFL